MRNNKPIAQRVADNWQLLIAHFDMLNSYNIAADDHSPMKGQNGLQ